MSGAPAIPPRPRRPSGLQREGATLQPPSGDTPPSASGAPSGSSPSNSRTVSPVRTRMPLSVAGQPIKALATPSHTKRISFAMDAATAGQGMIAPVEGEDTQSQLRSWTSKVAADNAETTEEGKDDYVFIPAEESKGTRSGRSSPAVGLTGRSSPATISQEERVARLHAIRTQGSRLDRWDEQLDKYPILHALEVHTGIRKVYFALLAMIGTISLVFFGLGTSLVCILVGFLYPMYMSFKALEDRDRNMDMLKQWLMYWVVYGLFTVFEHYSDTALNWVPMYNPLKLIFLLWCFLPKYNGATTIFHAFVRPIIVRNEAHIQGKILEVKDVASETITHMGLNLKDKGVKLGHALRKKSMDMWQQQQLARQQAASLRTPRGRSSLSIPENPYEPEDMHQPGLQTPSSTRSVLGKKLE